MKIEKENFLSAIISLIFSQIFIKILGMINSVYLTNKSGFGDAGNAIYMSGYQIYILALTICSIGVPNTISKLVAEREGNGDEFNSKRVFKISFYIFGILGFIGSLAMYFAASYISNNLLKIPEAEYTLIALAPSVFFVSINSVFKGYFNGRKMIKVVAKSQFYEQLIKTISTIILVEIVAVLSKNNTKLMASIANIGTTISTIITFIYIIRIYFEFKEERKINYSKERILHIVKQIFSLLIPLSLTSFISALNKNIDSITVVRMLEKVYGKSIAKVKYGILSTKIDLLLAMPLSFNISIATALIPEIAFLKMKNNTYNIQNKIKTSLLISTIIGLPCTIGMFLYSNEIITLLFPNANLGGELLRIASLSIIFSCLTQTCNAALQGLDYSSIPIIALLIGAILKLVLNILLLNIEGIYEKGAVISTLISAIISFVIVLYSLIKISKLKISIKEILYKPCLVTFIMGIISYNIYILLRKILPIRLVILLVIFLSVIIYFSLIILLKVINIEKINEYYSKKIKIL